LHVRDAFALWSNKVLDKPHSARWEGISRHQGPVDNHTDRIAIGGSRVSTTSITVEAHAEGWHTLRSHVDRGMGGLLPLHILRVKDSGLQPSEGYIWSDPSDGVYWSDPSDGVYWSDPSEGVYWSDPSDGVYWSDPSEGVYWSDPSDGEL
jgi:hypothetical protein